MTQHAHHVHSTTTVALRTVVEDPALAIDVIGETLPAGALDRPVRWAHVSELRNPGPYLLGRELLLTAGVHLPEQPGDIDDYVRALLDAGITALGFGVTPPMHVELPPVLRRACARHRLPLVVVPPDTPFLAITRAVAVAVQEAEQRQRRAVADAREALTAAAGRGAESLVRELARRLAGWVVLIGQDDTAITGYRAPQPMPPEVRSLLHRLREGRGHRAATAELRDGTVVVAQPVYPMATASELLVVGRAGRFGDADRTILSVGAALCGLVGRPGPDARALGAATTALVLGDRESGAVLEDLLGPGDYRLLAGVPREGAARPSALAHDWLRSGLGTPLLRADTDHFTAVVTAVPEDALRDELRDRGWLTAVSSPRTAAGLVTARAEVDMLVQRARVLDRSVVAEDGMSGGDGGLGMNAVVPPEAAATVARRVLAPLVELDQHRDAALCATLRAWLARHGNWDRTAQALGIHRNSVRHRIRQVERALGVDLGDAQTRMELWFALWWFSADQ